MTRQFWITGCCILFFALPGRAQAVTDSSYVGPDGMRVLRHSIVIPASQSDVWTALTTTAGVKSWAVPVANVDFRVGGIWESSYDKNSSVGAPGNIQNKFLSYIPMRMLSMQAINAPPTFPHPEVLKDIFTVIEIEVLSPNSVRVTGSMVGYKNNEAHDIVYAFFAKGNATSLQQLYERFAKGPRLW